MSFKENLFNQYIYVKILYILGIISNHGQG